MKIKKVPEDLGGASIVTYVMRHTKYSDRKQTVKFIAKGNVKINGIKADASSVVSGGDIVEIYDGDYSAAENFETVFEDKNYIVVNKKIGIETSSFGAHEDKDLTDAVNAYLGEKDEYIEASGNIAYPCNRIEKYAGGLVLFAKNGEMFDLMIEAVRQRRVKFEYTAIVCGRIEPGTEFTLQNYISENEGKPYIKIYDRQSSGARPAVTNVKGILTNGEVSLVRCRPVTLLRHQIRGQLSVKGYPILGDQEYGNKKLNSRYTAKHQASWCSAIAFRTGSNNALSYLDGENAKTDHMMFPYVDFSSGN